jgi:WD40 repeat protein
LNADGSLLAIGLSDGTVKVWDVVAKRVVHEVTVGDAQIQGISFVDGRHLAVAPETGNVYLYTLDPAELLALVRESLVRGFTPAECQRYGFGESCPSLAELRGELSSP